MAPKHKSSSPLRHALGTALAGSLALIGCQNGPPTDVRPSVAATTPVSAAMTVAPTAVPPSQAATMVPSPDDTTATPAPLATASVDSDLPQDDESAIESLVDSEELKTYLPSTLIHDGGVILYQTLGLREARLDAAASGTAGHRTGCGGPVDPPENWHRGANEVGAHQLRVRRVPGQANQATLVVKWQNRGTLAYRDPGNGNPVRKKFVELDSRTLLLERTGTRWHPVGLSPIAIESQGGHAGLELDQVRLYRGSDTTPIMHFDEQAPIIDLQSGIPTFAPGEAVRIEVEVHDKLACPLFVYAHLVGGANQTRERLVDDGTAGDTAPGDGIYTGTFIVPEVRGTQHVAIDVLEPTVFTPGGIYRSNGLGMNFHVEATASPGPSASPDATASGAR